MQGRLRGLGAICVALGSIVMSVAWPAPAVAGPSSGALTPAYRLVVKVVGGQVPSDAEAVMLNVTAVQPGSPGFATVWQCDAPQPSTSNLNYTADTIAVPNAVVARVATDGTVCVTTLRPVDILVDLVGYFPAGSVIEPLEQPVRVLDTRTGTGAPEARVRAGGTTRLALAGVSPIPADATAVVLNATVVDPTDPGFVTVHPCDRDLPLASNINYGRGDFRPNLVVAAVDEAGRACLHSSAETDLVADAVAYFPAGSTGFSPLEAPVRVLDTRNGTGAPRRPIERSVPLAVRVAGRAGVPADATSVVLNLAATGQAGPGWVAAHPCGKRPENSTVNFVAEAAIANLTLVPIDPGGDVCVTSSISVDVIADVAAYVVGDDSYVGITPRRLVDTRRKVTSRCGMLAWRVDATTFAVRMANGTVRNVTAPALSDVTDLVIAPGCDGLVSVGGINAPVVTRVGLDGSSTSLFRFQLGTSSVANRLSVLATGDLVAMSYSGAFDVSSGDRLLYGSNAYRPVGMLPDGSAAVFVSSLLPAFEAVFVDASTGQEASRVDLPIFRGDPTLSPEGWFLGAGVPVRSVGGTVFDIPVFVDLNGELLDALEPAVPGPVTMHWIDDDTAIVCSPAAAPRAWTIFNGATPIAGAPVSSCPYGG